MSGYIGKTPLTDAQQLRKTYTATAGQADFYISYAVGFIDVYLNGVKQQKDVDFTATDGVKVTLIPAAKVNDIFNAVAYRQLEIKSGTYFPFYKASGALDPIHFTVDNKLPFFNSAGAAKNIALTV
jgi:hypothetical protein